MVKHIWIWLLMFGASFGWGMGQGAWIPANADLTYPRTLLKVSEIPAVQAYLSDPEIFSLYTTLWNGVQSTNPGNLDFNVNGHRRVAAHAAKNAAFILLLDRRPNGANLDTLTTQEASDLLSKAITLLEAMNTNVETYPDFGNYLWRANELTDNAIAYDLLKGAGISDATLATTRGLIQEYAGNLHEQITFDLFNLGLFSLHVDNHSLRSCGALGVAAVVLNDATSSNADDRPSNWFHTAMYNIDNVLFRDPDRQSDPGVIAGYSEGPHYLRFGMKHSLEFFHALHNFLPDTTFSITYENSTRSIRHPWHDPNYHNLFEWIVKIRMPDGRHPALEDCFIAACYPELAILEKSEFRGQLDFSSWRSIQPNSLYAQLRHSSDDVVADFIASMTPSNPIDYDHMLPMVESGNLVFRSDWDTSATYMHITAKHGRVRASARGHNHADVGSFILYARGELLALDAGYLKWDRRDEVSEAQNHNMILVDGQGPPDGSTGNAGDADGYIENYFDLPKLDYSEVRTTYGGTDFIRKPLFVREDYFVLGDFCTSANSHTYQWRLHGYGLETGDAVTGTCVLDSADGRGIWRKNGVRLLTQVTAKDDVDAFGSETNIHEVRYDSMEQHTTLLADVNGQDAAFLAAMVPFEADSPVVRTLCGTDCGALHVSRGGYNDYFFVNGMVTAAVSGLSADLVSDADLGFYSEDPAGDFDQYLMENGTVLALGSDTLGHTSVEMDLALQVVDSVHYTGYAGAAGTIWLDDLAFVPGSVLGTGIGGWTYDGATGVLEITTSGGGIFDIYEDVIIQIDDQVEAAELPFAMGPVPAIGKFEVVMEPGLVAESVEVVMTDARGRVVLRKSSAEMRIEVEVPQLKSGMYQVAIYADGRYLGSKRQVLVR
ncbi:MAG: heparinase II/III family protein [Bacteroidota bacterium]